MAHKPFYRRLFLNRRGHHAGAYAIAECAVETYRGKPDLDAYLKLADCSRVVTIDLSGSTIKEIDNAVRKVHVLHDVVTELCASVDAAAAEVKERRAAARN